MTGIITTFVVDLMQFQMMSTLMEARRGVAESSSRPSVRHLNETAVSTLEEFACEVHSSAHLHIGSPEQFLKVSQPRVR